MIFRSSRPPKSKSSNRNQAGDIVPVTLKTAVTGTGVLQLWCAALDGRRWKLEFNVRERVAE